MFKYRHLIISEALQDPVIIIKNMKKFILILILLFFSIHSRAQLFKGRDSIRVNSICQIGIGLYQGSYSFKVASGDLDYQYGQGVDRAIFLRGSLLLTKNFSLLVDLRNSQRSCFVEQKNARYSESFYCKQEGYQIPVTLKYVFINRQHKEIVGLYIGGNYNNVQFETMGNYLWIPPNTITTLSGSISLNGIKKAYYSYLAGVSKKVPLKYGLDFLVFGECEYAQDVLKLGMGFTDLNTGNYESYQSSFDGLSFRIGVCLIY